MLALVVLLYTMKVRVGMDRRALAMGMTWWGRRMGMRVALDMGLLPIGS